MKANIKARTKANTRANLGAAASKSKARKETATKTATKARKKIAAKTQNTAKKTATQAKTRANTPTLPQQASDRARQAVAQARSRTAAVAVMADGERFKEGEDFEWVKAKGSNYKTRRFFSREEKRKRKEQKLTAKATGDSKPTGSTPRSTESAPTTSARPKPRPARNNTGVPKPTRGPDDGSRAGQKPNRPVISRDDPLNKTSGHSTRVVRNQTDAPDTAGVYRSQIDRSPSSRTAPSMPQQDMASVAKRVAEDAINDKMRETSQPRSRTSSVSRRDGRRMAKGGLVKANCGASMKPTQKKYRKGKK